jgi:formylglycine-generating enzyme required for sulfatase activity
MKEFILVFVLSLLLISITALAQENSPPTPAVSDTNQSIPTTLVEPKAAITPDSSAAQLLVPEKEVESQTPVTRIVEHLNWIAVIVAAILTSLLTFLLNRLPRPLFNKDERRYRNTLRKKLGQIKLVGPGMDDISVRLEDTFVHLRISGEYRAAEHPELGSPARMSGDGEGYTPDQLIKETFVDLDYALLLVIGDPGSGKTTLMKYYIIKLLSKKGHKQLGFRKPPLPLFLPLREVDVEKTTAENLHLWCKKNNLTIKAATFEKWLQTKPTLILLDGLDEVRDAEERRKICDWIDACSGLDNACIVVTSRPTGYRGRDKVVLQSNLRQADIHDFTPDQREEFLHKWFTAAYLRETHLRQKEEPLREWKKSQKLLAQSKAKSLLGFLAQSKNKSLRDLSGIPMLLQIMAILWKKDNHLPKNRSKLYGIALDYLLEYRDAQRQLDPLLSADQAQRVLSPACLWMQEEWQHEEVPKNVLYRETQKILKNIPDAPSALAFCENIRERAGILAENTETEYIFRHKSFREYFAGLELAKSYNKKRRLPKLAKGFFDDWWEEPLRFFISKSDGEAFDNFMAALFRITEIGDRDPKLMNRLVTLVGEAPEPKISALANFLQNPATRPGVCLAILECLKAINTPQALGVVEDFFRKQGAAQDIQARAGQIIREREAVTISQSAAKMENPFKTLPKSFLNPIEYNAEYILIPGGKFNFSLTKKVEEAPNLYFAKYPLTNKRYRRFIRYLQGEESEIRERLPLQLFGEKLLEFAAGINGYPEYLGSDAKAWPEKLRSGKDDDRKFNGDDQPVVKITWFDARAYCFWLSLFEAAKQENGLQKPVEKIAGIYRLPHEMEWERAAAGLATEKDAPRKYPWGKDDPTDKLANFGGNVGKTTVVGRYPEGATPEGLLDMAGNVWEWQENWYNEEKESSRSLRGGSWVGIPQDLACAIRNRNDPDLRYSNVGFRVVRSQSVFETR